MQEDLLEVFEFGTLETRLLGQIYPSCIGRFGNGKNPPVERYVIDTLYIVIK